MAKTIKDYQNAYNEAKKKGDKQGMAAAHAGAESIRADKGYSGGVDGSQYISIKKPSSGGSSSSKRPGGMSGMLAGMAGAMGNAVSGTLGGKRPSGGSSSSRPSGGSSGNGFYAGTDFAQDFNDNRFSGDFDKLQSILDTRLDKLGGTADSWQTGAQTWLDNQKKNYYDQQQGIVDAYEDALNGAMNDFMGKQDAIEAENQAAVDRNVADLNAQKPNIQQAGERANQAAQQNYMNVLNPNGANAEMLASMGLTNSGMSESAAIAANNAYTQAVNSNEQNVNNQLAAIDLAIENAKLLGDLTTAQQLQSFYDTVLQAGLQNAGNILSANQWATTNKQNQVQQGINNAFTQAGLTGQLNGKPTMEGQKLSYTIEGMSLDNQLKQFELLLQKGYGMDRAAAEIKALELANNGQSLENQYQEYYNNWMKSQM